MRSRYQVASQVDTYRIYELSDSETDSLVRICPERGGIVIGCKLRGEELLYLDHATFLDPNANIRGGIPILFPICGQLEGGRYEWDGQVYSMRNHGVARTSVWEVVRQSDEDEASITLVLRSNEETLSSYPFDFELQFTYRLKDGKLELDQTYANRSASPMPVQAGFHPYFATGEGKKLAYESDATEYLDYNDGKIKPFEGTIDLGGLKESVALLNARTPAVSFPLAGKGTVRLDYSEAFRAVVFWSVEGKPFICVEPWTAPNEALNRKEGLISVKPGEPLQLQLSISYS
ncbi:aldose epimerase [Cohnella sp. CBP 2801]|uniref:Aldose epimerase n=2 Tax=Cohnella zeiphila TaxID=2761120 RepID=A0A7X0SLQ0_9BACL|nr:aldose epimerase [Cohnella zeiphila]